MFVVETGTMTLPRYIINFPTKRHWRGKSRLEDIEAGLQALVSEIRTRDIRSIAIPPLGSGLGGLNWYEVKPLIEQTLAEFHEVEILVFEPLDPGTEVNPNRSSEVPKMTPGRATLVGLMDRYLAALLDPFITLLEVHKLLYFLQEADEPLRLNYVKGSYGPYAENLRHVLHAIEGHLITGYADGGDAPQKELNLVPGAVQESISFLESYTTTHARFDRVVHLVEGFETPFGLELLSTVHWVVTREDAHSSEAIQQAVYAWSPIKKKFSSEQIQLAAERLTMEGWITASTGS
jgi:O-acetyl-ADP-ribose deacetylase (regulator of RNase III)